jgi:hypothetical protein
VTLNRRDALKQLALGSVGAATMPVWVDSLSAFAAEHAQTHPRGQQTAGKTAWKPKVFTADQNATVIVVSELIIPQTDTPGAKAARVNEFIDGVLAESKAAENRTKFLAGLAWLDDRARGDHQHPFVGCTPEQQTALLTAISTPDADPTGGAFFAAIKSLTIIGYYTSEVGLRQELGDDGNLVFAEFKGCTHPEHQTQQA